MKQQILSNNAPAPIGPYSQAIKSGNMIFISGQIAINPKTNELVNDLMWNLGRPGAVNDLTLITQIEDITEMVGDVLTSFPTITQIDGTDEEE